MLKFLVTVFLLQLVSSQQVAFQDDLMEGQFTIVVEDNLGSAGPDSSWSERTLITIRNVKLAQSQITHTRKWNTQLTQKLKGLVKEKDFYRLRLHSKNDKEPTYVYTFTDACMLYKEGLSEILSLLVDANPSLGGFTHYLVGASVMVPGSSYCDYQDSDAYAAGPPLAHNTTVLIRSPAAPTAPDTATFIQKMETLSKEKLENKDNRSFIAKYWMYIVPLVILMLVKG